MKQGDFKGDKVYCPLLNLLLGKVMVSGTFERGLAIEGMPGVSIIFKI